MLDNLRSWKVILASASPRRRELLARLDIPFTIRVQEDIDECYPTSLHKEKIPEYLCQKKAAAQTLADDELLITADTIVVLDDTVLGKPKDAAAARIMLRQLSGKTHQVITACCLRTNTRETIFSVCSDVTFAPLAENDIDYYVEQYKPFDKAGAYGVQEWIGCVGVTSIKGSYFNVMGLPVQRLYAALREF